MKRLQRGVPFVFAIAILLLSASCATSKRSHRKYRKVNRKRAKACKCSYHNIDEQKDYVVKGI